MEQDDQIVNEQVHAEEQPIGLHEDDDETEEFKANKRNVCKQVNKWYAILLVSLGFIFLIRFSLSNTIPLFPSFLLLINYKLVSVANSILLYKRSRDENIISMYKKELIINVLMVLFYAYLLAFSFISAAKLVYCSIPIGLCVIYDKFNKVIFFTRIREIADKFDYAVNFITFATLLMVGLKQNHSISWTWFSVFTPIWITVLILIVISCIQVQICISIIKKSFSGENCSGLIDPLFNFLVTSGLAGCLIYLFISLSLELDNGLSVKTNKALMILTAYQIVLFSISFILHRHIKYILFRTMLHTKFYPDDFAENIEHHAIEINIQELVEVHNYPKKMKKISSTYFVPVEELCEIIVEPEEQSIDGCRVCVICCAVEPNSIFMNCGHSGACFECACDVWKKTKNCMICSGRIEMLIKFEGIEYGLATIVKAVKYLSK